jgi:hypothetical protein
MGWRLLSFQHCETHLQIRSRVWCGSLETEQFSMEVSLLICVLTGEAIEATILNSCPRGEPPRC